MAMAACVTPGNASTSSIVCIWHRHFSPNVFTSSCGVQRGSDAADRSCIRTLQKVHSTSLSARSESIMEQLDPHGSFFRKPVGRQESKLCLTLRSKPHVDSPLARVSSKNSRRLNQLSPIIHIQILCTHPQAKCCADERFLFVCLSVYVCLCLLRQARAC
jgi:hypothetical protein